MVIWIVGARLACLVNASVTVCGDDEAIYAFGGFDQYTDEGMVHNVGWVDEVVPLAGVGLKIYLLTFSPLLDSVQSRAEVGPAYLHVDVG